MSEQVLVSVERGIMTLTLNRPEKKNALTNAMYGALAQSLQRAESDTSVRAVLLQASGDAFTSGNDLGDFAAVAAGKLAREDMQSSRFLSALAYAQKPLIAAVQGLAVGIGTTILLHCDFAFVADDAALSTPFVNLGLVPEAASSLLLPARIGYARAFKMFALGEPLSGRDAVALGLATACAPANEIQKLAAATAAKVAGKPLGALKAMKSLLRDAELIQSTMRREAAVFGERLQSPEAKEAFQAFAERRPPDFSKFA